MNTEKFGAFIASTRKEQNMTQLALARKLDVTDKAVSKWERGLGLPDINTIEPLAEALGVSVLELMHAERITQAQVPQETADTALSDMVEIAKGRKNGLGKIAVISGFAVFGILLVFLYRYSVGLAANTFEIALKNMLGLIGIPLYICAVSFSAAFLLQEVLKGTLPQRAKRIALVFAIAVLLFYGLCLLSIGGCFRLPSLLMAIYHMRYALVAVAGILLALAFKK